jgi:hypothetical protein
MNKWLQNHKFIIVIFLLAALWLVPLGQALAITYGQADIENQFANAGVIWLPDPRGGMMQWCSGVLIGEREFLTAGHCTFFVNNYLQAGYFSLEDVKVSFDPLGGTDPAGFWDVEVLITHPDLKFAQAQMYDDFGIVILKQKPGITPAQLAPLGYLDQLKAKGSLVQGNQRAEFTVVGYGVHLSWPPPALYDDVPGPTGRYFTDTQYQSLTSKWLHYNQNPKVGTGGICFCDSGGPTFWTDSDGNRILVAINSWVGAVNCNANGYSYRVDLPEIHDFIQTIQSQY